MKHRISVVCIGSCLGLLAFGCGENDERSVYDTPFGGTGPSALVQCEVGEHVFDGKCELNSIENCGEHGNTCELWQECNGNGMCVNRLCTYYPREERSPAVCAGDGRYILFCGSNSIYYLAQNGICAEGTHCVVCADGYGGCASDEEEFCRNHQTAKENNSQTHTDNVSDGAGVDRSYIPETCVKNAYPSMCVNNTGYMCGAEGYYSSRATRCDNSNNSCVVCDNGYVGCTDDPESFCAEKKSVPKFDPNKCRLGHRRCDGKKVMECDGTSYSKFVEKCNRYCVDGVDGEDSECGEKIPKCTIKDGSKAKIVVWNDGDTVVVTPKWTGLCSNNNDHQRYSLRILGVDTPECSKAKNAAYNNIQTCILDENWSSTNDPFGYEAWKHAMSIFPPETEVTITCDTVDEYNNCGLDKGGRPLAYISANGYDYSTQFMLSGLTMPNIQYVPSLVPQEKGVCEALDVAIEHRSGLWSECTEGGSECVKQGAARLYSTKPHEFDRTYARCQYVLDMMGDR